MTMEQWDDSRAQALLDSASKLEAGEPPPLAGIRQVAAARQRRAAYLLSAAILIPLGAAAAAGTWVVREHARSGPAGVKTGHPVAAALILPEDLPPSTPKPAPAPGPAPMPDGPMKKPGVTMKPAPVQKAADEVIVEAHANAPSLGETVDTPSLREAAEPRSVRETQGDSPYYPGAASTRAGTGRLENAETPALGGTPEIPTPTPVVAPREPDRTSLSEESALLSVTLTALRTQHMPELALKHVTEYRSRFPHGALKLEMTLAAAEAQRALGHTASALSELETLKATSRDAELTVLRAELNAELGHCEVARAELAPAMLELKGSLRSRAFYTDASCAAAAGQRADAVARLESLLSQSPSDARAHALLEQLK